MLKKLMMPLMALTLAFGISAASVKPAEAGRGGRVAAGIALGLVGAALIARSARAHRYRDYNRCYRGPRRCGYVGNRRCWENRWGRIRCTGGRYKCWRPRYCD